VDATVPSRSLEPSLADVLSAVSAAPNLTMRRRQDMASAIRVVARILDRPLELIPADPPLLRRRLAEIAPMAIGMTKQRWSNLRSLLTGALALTRPMLPNRHPNVLSPAWQALHQRLPTKSCRTRLSRLLHWLSCRGIEPVGVSRAHLEEFAGELCRSMVSNPAQRWREAAWTWNRARRTVPAWPAITASIPNRRKDYSLPWTTFPPSLKADADLFLARIAGNDLLEDLPFKPVRPETRRLREVQLRRFASVLVHRGRDPATLRTVADIVTFEAFKEGLRFFLDRKGGASSSAIEQLATFLKSVAKYWVKADAETLDGMAAVIRRLSVPQQGLTRKNRDRLRPLEDPDNVLALLNLPKRMMMDADSGRLPIHQAAVLAQVAIAIEILLMVPLRVGNLTRLDIDRHLVRPGRARHLLHIVMEEQEVKNSMFLDHPLPEESIALIDHYLKRYHSRLAGDGNRALFPGEGSGPKSRNTLSQQIKKLVFRYTGLTVNPHLFRHIGAKLHLDSHPGEHSIVSRVLGHRSIDTTTRFYTGFEAKAAAKHFDKTILDLRKDKSGEKGVD
jgi:integrase